MPKGVPKVPKESKGLHVVSAEKRISPYGGQVTLYCTMSDGSAWSCQRDGSNFVKEVPPLEFLNECFQNQQKTS